jgi:cobalamin 5'-phosphate synthase/cobalamin synthase
MPRLFAAIGLLTRIPVRRAFDPSELGGAAFLFPVVGAGIGVLQLGAFLLLAPRLPSLLAAVAVVALSAWLTRGLHLDGLADFADGLGGGRDREDALRIMRDPSVGAFGVAALVLVLAAKIAGVDALPSPAALVLAPALARFSIVPLCLFLPDAREGSGLASPIIAHLGPVDLAAAALVSAALVLVLAPRRGALCFGAVVLVSFLVAALARKRLGGVTGDVLGANVELSEAAALSASLLTC